MLAKIKKSFYLCNVKMYVLAIQVSFLRGQAVTSLPILKPHFECGFIFLSIYFLRKLFIIIFKKPLLQAMLRLTEISLLPENIKTSTALGDISKWCLISSVMLRMPYVHFKFSNTLLVWPIDSLSRLPMEFLPTIVFRSNIL